MIYLTSRERLRNRIGSNRDRLRSILCDWFDYRPLSKIDVRLCSITEPNRTIGVRLGSTEFWFDFFRLDTPGTTKRVWEIIPV